MFVPFEFKDNLTDSTVWNTVVTGDIFRRSHNLQYLFDFGFKKLKHFWKFLNNQPLYHHALEDGKFLHIFMLILKWLFFGCKNFKTNFILYNNLFGIWWMWLTACSLVDFGCVLCSFSREKNYLVKIFSKNWGKKIWAFPKCMCW